MTAPKDTKNKLDMNKLDLGLLSELLCPAYAVGDIKYYPESWREGFPVSKTIAAALRHIDKFKNGNDFDAESQEEYKIDMLHLGAAIFALLATYNSLKIDPEKYDDRWQKMQKQRQQEYKEKQAKAEESRIKNIVENYIDSVGLNIPNNAANEHVYGPIPEHMQRADAAPIFSHSWTQDIKEKMESTASYGMAFKPIEPGKFIMGSPENEPGRYTDEIQHEVTLTKGFYMQTTPVTQGQWAAIMGNSPSYFQISDNHPVESVSWEEAKEFIALLNSRTEGVTYRLPTEAEWEYACRAGSNTPYANGNNLDEMGWSINNSLSTTQPVAQKKPNNWGLYDMHGNVWEWCEDWYGDYSPGSVTDPTGANSGTGRVIRGGSWLHQAGRSRSAKRGGYSPSSNYYSLGFRLVMEIHE